ncbi:MAG: N,N-dimethylformamidase beta subunit family domain-containing protein [Actinomycetes bacterium]
MPGRFGKKSIVSSLVIAVVVLASTLGAVSYKYIQSQNDLPQVKSHSDIAKQPMQSFADSLETKAPKDLAPYPSASCPALTPNWISTENAQPGIAMTPKDWRSLNLQSAQGSALWLNKSSGSCGDSVDIHASLYGSSSDTFRSGARSIEALRIGWYQGSGARQVWSSGPIELKEQKIQYPKSATRMIDTKWPTTIKLTLGAQWVPGFYLFITRSFDGTIENSAPFVLHSPLGSSKLMLMHSFITWNVYNTFGGRSGYFGAGSTKVEQRLNRSRVVSMDRPIVGSGGFSIHRDGISIVQFMEKQGINYDQFTDLDIDSWPSVTKKYNGLILGGHPEYFTRRIFESLLSARNSGVNIAILGGNTAIWQMRLGPSKTGPNRQISIYRKAIQDPVVDLRLVSIKFADKRLNIPPTLLTGAVADGVHVYGDLKSVQIPRWLNLPMNSQINGISPDSEVEHVVESVATPPNIHVLFSGTMHYRDAATVGQPARPVPQLQSIWFTTPSGAAIFNAGVTTWSCDLIETCAYSTVDAASRATMVSVTAQILNLWQTKAVGKTLSK